MAVDTEAVTEGTPLVPAVPKVQRSWRNSWAMLFGDGSPSDVAACCLAYHAPCVAFGWNHSRGLQFSFWREVLRFLLFTLGTFVFIKVACCAVVMLSCPPPAFGPMDASGVMVGPAGQVSMSGSTTASGATTTAAMPHPDDWHHHRHHGDPMDSAAEYPHAMPMGVMMRDPECARRAVPGLVVVFLLAVAMVGYFVFFAARRRQALREKFGIEGSFLHDVSLWAWCSLCALSQETRTLMHEQVHEGVWYGAIPATAPPANQCMAV